MLSNSVFMFFLRLCSCVHWNRRGGWRNKGEEIIKGVRGSRGEGAVGGEGGQDKIKGDGRIESEKGKKEESRSTPFHHT